MTENDSPEAEDGPSLTVTVSAEVGEFVEDIEEAKQAVDEFRAALERLDTAFEELESISIADSTLAIDSTTTEP